MPAAASGGHPAREAVPSADRSKLAWIENQSKEPLRSFLDKHAPSQTNKSSGGDGWIWVCSKQSPLVTGEDDFDNEMEAVKAADEALKSLQTRFAEIDANDKIPKFKTKTSGPSKKMLRDAAMAETEAKLRECGQASPSGAWLFFERPDFVDWVFRKLAESVIDGPLSKLKHAKCHTVKVVTADAALSRGREGEQQHFLCLFFQDVWNKEHATEVLECIVKEHAEVPNSCKPDLYKYVGLQSKHPSNIRSTLYRPDEIFNRDLMREWQTEARARDRQKREAVGNGARATKKPKLSPTKPVDPAKFWASETAADDEFEAEVANETGVKKAETEDLIVSSGQPQATSKSQAPVNSATDADSDTETESESGDQAPKSSKSALEQSSDRIAGKSASPRSKTTSDKKAVDERQGIKDGESNSSPPSPPIKSTPLIVATRKHNRKRDRFGRDDF